MTVSDDAPPPGTLTLPGVPLPKKWSRHPEYRLEADPRTTEMWLVGEGTLESFELPHEILPALVEADVSSDGAALNLCRRFGHLGVSKRWLLSDHSDPVPLFGQSDLTGFSEALSDFRCGLAALKALLVLDRSTDSLRSAADLDRLREGWPAGAPWPAPDTPERASDLFTEEYRRALSAADLSVELKAVEVDRGSIPAPFVTVRFRHSLYSVAVVELFNAALAGRPFRKCQNETCGRFFSIHSGPSKYGGHRSGAKYCSRDCSRAEAARRYRARKRRAPSGE